MLFKVIIGLYSKKHKTYIKTIIEKIYLKQISCTITTVPKSVDSGNSLSSAEFNVSCKKQHFLFFSENFTD